MTLTLDKPLAAPTRVAATPAAEGLFTCPLDGQSWAVVPGTRTATPGARIPNGPGSSHWHSDGPRVPLTSDLRMVWADDDVRSEYHRHTWACGDHECFTETTPRPGIAYCTVCEGGYRKPVSYTEPSRLCDCCNGYNTHVTGGQPQPHGKASPTCGADLS